MDIGFGEALVVVGALLAIAAGLSGLMHGTVLSISVLAVAAGFALAATDVVAVRPGDEALIYVIELALILTLFSDGLLVERELLRMHWGPPARAIAIAMPITLVLLALGAKALFSELTWAEAFLLGAVLSPTDPVVTSALVTARRVPERVRHTLNLESGLNDGLALPFVLFFLILASPAGDAPAEGLQLLGEAVAGALIGVALGLAAGRLVPHLPGGGITRRYEGLYALGLGLFAYGIADVTIANGFIAAFVCGVALARAEHEIPEAFRETSESVSSIFQIVTFFVFGALVVATGYAGNVAALLAFVVFALVVARPLAIRLSFLRSRLAPGERLFIAWFGPKGVASMLFALFVLNSAVGERSVVFEVASFVILASILAHGFTDTLGASWIDRRLEGGEAEGPDRSAVG